MVMNDIFVTKKICQLSETVNIEYLHFSPEYSEMKANRQ